MEFLKCYKEIFLGFALGAAMWLIDAVMHTELGESVHAGSLWAEIFTPHPTALIFRSIYMVIAISFGVFLWRTNWRERQLRALEKAVIAFQRQLDAPALRILGAAQQLQNRNSIQLDETAERLTSEINLDARLIDELAKKYLEFSRLVQAGETSQAIETLRAIESWLAEQKSVAKS